VNRTEKAAVVADLSEAFADASALFLADFRGLTVGQAMALRRKCREEGVSLRVVKNTLAKLALAGTDKEPLAVSFVGPTAVAWTDGDPVAPAKVLANYAAENDKLVIKEGFLDGDTLTPAEVGRLAKLPGRDALRSQLLSVLVAPMQQIVSIVAAPLRDVVGVLEAKAKETGETEDA